MTWVGGWGRGGGWRGRLKKEGGGVGEVEEDGCTGQKGAAHARDQTNQYHGPVTATSYESMLV